MLPLCFEGLNKYWDFDNSKHWRQPHSQICARSGEEINFLCARNWKFKPSNCKSLLVDVWSKRQQQFCTPRSTTEGIHKHSGRCQSSECYRIAERQAAATCKTLICYEVSSCHIDHGVARSHSACVIKTVINHWWRGALASSEILKTGNYRALFTCCRVQTWGAKREPIRDPHTRNYLLCVPYTITLCDWVSAWVTSERQRTGVTYIKVNEMESSIFIKPSNTTMYMSLLSLITSRTTCFGPLLDHPQVFKS